MKEIYVENIAEKEVVQDFFMVKSISVRVGANKKEYLDVTLADKTGEISGKKWDVASESEDISSIKEGSLIKVRANVVEWNGAKQLKLTKIREALPNDNLVIGDYIKAAPEEPNDMFDFVLESAENLNDNQLRELCITILNKEKERLLYYPAATKNHHAQLGGLLYHLKRMIIAGEKMCQVYDILDKDLVISGVILHDMQKLNEIISSELGIANEYSFEGNMLGHLVLGVRELEKEMNKIGFSREKAVMVEHMVLSHHYEPEFGSPKRPLFPEAEILHYLDVIDARMFDMEEALKNTEVGSFSERVWTLENRRLYKRGIELDD